MYKIIFMVAMLVLAAIIMSACQNEQAIVAQEELDNPEAATLLKARPRPQTWVDGELFAGVVTPATFKPESDPFDELYTGGNGFKDGVPLISESKPGDQDYNGGRWHKNVLNDNVDPDKYADATSVEDLDLNDFDSTEEYFECPLLPRRGKNRN
jgi:hypothetical protein